MAKILRCRRCTVFQVNGLGGIIERFGNGAKSGAWIGVCKGV